MAWMVGTIEEYKVGRPEHRDFRKIRTQAGQKWEELFFFKVPWALRAGYPESELVQGRQIEFEPDLQDPRPKVLRFKPYSEVGRSPSRPGPARTFLNPYHFVPLAPPAPASLTEDKAVLNGTLHDRFGGDRFSGRIVCRLETEGPVVIGAEQKQESADRERIVHPFGLPDPEAPEDPYRRTPMIPGSTLRGLISSIVEAASCSTLRVLADETFKFRDAQRQKAPLPGSVHTSVAQVAPDLVPLHAGRSQLTLAERLFGFVEQGGKERTFAGRLRFAHAFAEGEAPEGGWYEDSVVLRILDDPKPPSPALYFGNQGYLARRALDLRRHSPQGRKFYLHHRKDDVAAHCYGSNNDERMKQKARVRPLKANTRFLLHVDFENVTSEELGYLLYALRPTPEFRHKIGMAKPLGLGRVRIDPLSIAFIDRQDSYAAGSLFGPKFHSLESGLEVAEWRELSSRLAQRYRYEAEAAGAPLRPSRPFPRRADLVQQVRAAMPERVRYALELLGDPSRVEAEVTYPVRFRQDPESETFKWFVTNDKEKRKALPPLKPGKGLPELERY